MKTPRKNASPYPRGRRACAWCGAVKPFMSGVRYCSPTCGAYGRTVSLGDRAMKASATRASLAAAASRAQAVLDRIGTMTPLEAYRYGRTLGYNDGYHSGAYTARHRKVDA